MNNSFRNGVGASPGVRPVPDAQSLWASGRTPGSGRTQGDAPTPFRPIRDALDIATCELDAEGHCITCSDEALTARVTRVDELLGLASVTIEEAENEVDITLLDEVAEGDLLLVHGGVAIGKIEAQDA